MLKTFKQYKGAARLFIDLVFQHDGVDDRLTLFSKKFSVAPGYELYHFLDTKNLRHHAVTKVEM